MDQIIYNLHQDFIDYVYSSQSVAYENFNFERIIGGIINWLNNLSQSNRMIDISHDWSICLMISRTEEVPRGRGKKRKFEEDDDQSIRSPASVSFQST